MLGAHFSVAVGESLRVLCLGAHADDIEIGAGGTILRLLGEYPATVVEWVVLSAEGERAEEAESSAGRFLVDAKEYHVRIEACRENFFPYDGAAVKELVADVGSSANFDIVICPRRKDLHQDHRLLGELALNTFRDHLILEYEIPKYDADLSSPNLYVPLDPVVTERKVELIVDGFPSQRHKPWFDAETFRGLMRLRGVECNERFAEGFHVHKLVL
ncbi:MAG: hypothetical protein JJLCMIEE_00285 [Acidimicrobiales bacterium]|nr:MAG: PIG-L family deacetylase [Actinomycetota bacterium]MBV6507244.1 hypothetical protein [Acidimicrobiales bacterium]RIK05475.1 MAG: PIG-L domain-containing protein [Acidobacteriota bacterium]